MSLWQSTDVITSAPKFDTLSGLGIQLSGQELFANTSIFANAGTGNVHANIAVSVEGLTPAEKANTPGPQHAGWVNKVEGTGGIASIAVTNGGTGYSGNGFITFTGGGSGSGANATYTVNGGGSISAVTLVAGGANYNAATVTANAVAAFTTPAVFVVTKGGRAGRVQYETLVASGSIA
jgi:hypothetical protein